MLPYHSQKITKIKKLITVEIDICSIIIYYINNKL